MTFGRKLDFFVLAVGVLLLGWCTIHDPTPTYRYRLTVEVETPEGLRTGSSVIEVDTQQARFPLNPSAATVSFRVRGEAVAVDLPGDRTLFTLLRSENDVDWAGRVMLMAGPELPQGVEATFDNSFDNMRRLTSRATLPRMWPPVGHLPERSAYPLLAYFRDKRDPNSVERVDPDNLAEIFGAGVALRKFTVEKTDDPVTTGIEARLPSTGDRGFFNWDGTSNPNDGFVVRFWDFSKEEN